VRIRPTFVLPLLVVALAACGSNGSGSTSSTNAPGPSDSASVSTSAPAGGPITVFAASSLKESFTKIAADFEAANPGAKVTLNFGASSGLATQITQGGPADVFASASQKTMDVVTAAKLADASQVFAVNTMEIATPPQATVAITGLADLAKPNVKVAVCAKEVPCGVAATKLFDANKLMVTPATQEVDVKAVLSKVELGEVDAGIVYVTDVNAAGAKVVGVKIPADQNVTTKYPIAVINTSKQAAEAKAFVEYVASAPAQAILQAQGFTSP